MAENSKIEWTTHTFNPWIGCTKVGPGCDNCYAEHLMDHRLHRAQWGAGYERKRTSPANWRKPLSWNRQAKYHRPRVFCASLADVFDNEVPLEWRADLFRLICQTPNLDWLLLTKRIGNVQAMLDATFLRGLLPVNVWLGVTVVTQAEADRDIPKLIDTNAQIKFLSCEPLLESVDLEIVGADVLELDWVICGGESGAKARPLESAWARSLHYQCQTYGIAFFMKQGSAANWRDFKNFASFPDALRVREFPRCD